MPYDAAAPVEVTARDRLLRLRDFLAELPEDRFNMDWWTIDSTTAAKYDQRHESYCGTVCCIGGWAETLYAPHMINAPDSFARVARLLGLSDEQAGSLFYPDTEEVPYADITTAQAVACIDHYLETGAVDWPRAIRETK